MSGPVPILLYHSVRDDPAAGQARWTVSPAQFDAHVEVLVASGRSALTVAEVAACLRGARPWPEAPLAVTFDDGYADTYVAAMKLVERGLAASIYATTGRLDGPSWLSRDALATLGGTPRIQLGAHTIRHLRLDEVGAAEVAWEVRGSKAALEDAIQRPVTSFAYPHGAHDARVRAAVIGAGFRSAVAVKNALSHAEDDPYAIARWTVTAATSPRRLEEVLRGYRVPLAWREERLRTRTYRTMRRTLRHPTRGAL